MALMTELINSEPSSFREAAQHDVWQEAMVEEYDSIMKDQVWEVLLCHKGKDGGIQMDLQGEACSRLKRGEVHGVLHGKGVFTEGGY